MNTLVLPGDVMDRIAASITQWAPLEDMCFVWVKRHELADGSMRYVGVGALLLDAADAVRQRFHVSPKPALTELLYRSYLNDQLHEQDVFLLTVHSHPFAGHARFSGTDTATMARDRVVWHRMAPGAEFLWVVFNRDCSDYEGLVVAPSKALTIDQLVVVGRTYQRRHAKTIPITWGRWAWAYQQGGSRAHR